MKELSVCFQEKLINFNTVILSKLEINRKKTCDTTLHKKNRKLPELRSRYLLLLVRPQSEHFFRSVYKNIKND